MHEWSLLFFTLALQCAAGGVLALALVDRLGSDRILPKEILVFAVIAVVGTIFSMTHLGDITGFYRALSHPAQSWLSREAWLAGIFAGLMIVCVILIWKQSAFRLALSLSALVGLLAVYASGAVYATSIMDKWTSICPYADFFATALLLGPLLVYLLRNEEMADTRLITMLFCLGVGIFIINEGFFGSRVQGCLGASRLILSAVGIVLGLAALFQARNVKVFTVHAKVLTVAALICLALGEALGRYIFFLE